MRNPGDSNMGNFELHDGKGTTMRDWRLNIQCPISLLVFIHENPNDSQSYEGQTLDISSRGMQVQIDGMDKASYIKLSAHLRLVRVSLRNTITGQQIQLPGCIAWYNYYQANGSGEPEYCKMGILFDKKDDVGLPVYSDFVNILRLQTESMI